MIGDVRSGEGENGREGEREDGHEDWRCKEREWNLRDMKGVTRALEALREVRFVCEGCWFDACDNSFSLELIFCRSGSH